MHTQSEFIFKYKYYQQVAMLDKLMHKFCIHM